MPLQDLIAIADADFDGHEVLRQRLVNTLPKYGNDDDAADALMTQTFRMLFESIDGRPNTKGGAYRLEMLPTTCHVYFGEVCGASADGRRAGEPALATDHVKTGGTLLNMKFTPGLLEGEGGIDRLHSLVRSYFKLDGHHVQFNVVTAATLRQAQADPSAHRDLIVRVAGYSDYFCDLSAALQDEIIHRTEHAEF
jgi:formate C-acetyltransferase